MWENLISQTNSLIINDVKQRVREFIVCEIRMIFVTRLQSRRNPEPKINNLTPQFRFSVDLSYYTNDRGYHRGNY